MIGVVTETSHASAGAGRDRGNTNQSEDKHRVKLHKRLLRIAWLACANIFRAYCFKTSISAKPLPEQYLSESKEFADPPSGTLTTSHDRNPHLPPPKKPLENEDNSKLQQQARGEVHLDARQLIVRRPLLHLPVLT